MSRAAPTYLVSTSYEPGWNDYDGALSDGRTAETESAAIQLASEQVAEMRRGGAGSAIRKVYVKHWPNGSPLIDQTPIFEASYFDAEQRLTEAEAYAARAHRWHAVPDRIDAHMCANGSRWGMGYSHWDEAWGPLPDVCPHCGRKPRTFLGSE